MDELNRISISTEEYRRLVESGIMADYLLNILKAAAKLSYDKSLKFDSDVNETAFRVQMPDSYSRIVKTLEQREIEWKQRIKEATQT